MLLFQLSVILVITYYLYIKFKRRNLPPGPFPYPLVGSAIQIALLDHKPHVALQKIAKKYGPIFSIKTGVVENVVVSGLKKMKEFLLMDELINRVDYEWALDRSYGSTKYGLFFSTNTPWRDNRRHCQRVLKDFGFGNMKSMEELIMEEFQVLVERIKDSTSKNNGILRIELVFNGAFVNIITSFLTGIRFDQDDPKLHELCELAFDWFQSANFGGGPISAYPFLKDWAPEFCGFARNHRSNLKMFEYFTKLVNEFREKGHYKTSPSSFIEVGLKNLEEQPEENGYHPEMFTMENLLCTLNDIFSAGSETSANSTAFAVRRLVQNPDIQKKIQDEVDRVVGRDRCVSLADKPNLKYLEAFMMEVLRSDTVAPFSPRKCNKTFQIDGYEIPAGMNVLINIYSANMDKTVWGDPDNFRPERFLSDKGEIINGEKIASFTFGKRDCIGSTVAKNTLFLVIACFAQSFTFAVDPATGMPGDGVTKSITLAPEPFNVLVKIR